MCTNLKPKSINAIKRTYYYCCLIELHSTVVVVMMIMMTTMTMTMTMTAATATFHNRFFLHFIVVVIVVVVLFIFHRLLYSMAYNEFNAVEYIVNEKNTKVYAECHQINWHFSKMKLHSNVCDEAQFVYKRCVRVSMLAYRIRD